MERENVSFGSGLVPKRDGRPRGRGTVREQEGSGKGRKRDVGRPTVAMTFLGDTGSAVFAGWISLILLDGVAGCDFPA